MGNKFDWPEKAREAYGELELRYTVQDRKGYEKSNSENLEKMSQVLKDVGVYLFIDGDRLSISISPATYHYKKTRLAGRREKHIYVDYRIDEYGRPDWCRYSDVIWLSQTMTDRQVAEKLGMKIATYYRHKKQMKESDYYKSLDRNRLSDREYLESVGRNYYF